jgi:hypothetical protein
MKALMKALLICMFIVVAFCIFFAVQSSDSAHKPATIINAWEQPSKEAPVPNALKVSAMKLYVDYQRNEVAADSVYKGRLLAVQGIVTSINKDFLDKIYIQLAAPNEFESVQAHLDEGNESNAAALQRGESVSLLCTGGGMIIGSPMLEKCSFYDAQVGSAGVANAPSIAVADKPFAAKPVVQQDDESIASGGGTITPLNQGVQVGADGVYKIGGAVSAPVLIYSVEPEFTEEARKAKVGGNVLVNLWVGTDGLPSHVHAIRAVYVDKDGHASSGPLSGGNGLGLEDKAVEAVRQYKFKPAMDDGKPVLVELNVDVNFQIF